MSHRLLYCTCPDTTCAERLGKMLVEERLLACANIVPAVRSIYEWQGELCQDEEAILLGKCTAERWPQIAERLRSEHPDEVPGIVSLPIDSGDPDFLDWVTRMTSTAS